MDTKPSLSFSLSSKEISQRAKLPRRTLFSPEQQRKRKRSTSPDQDAENRCGKQQRLKSPTRMPKSQSFSMAPSTSGESFRKQLFQRTQSEVAIPGSNAVKTLGYTEAPMPSVVKKVNFNDFRFFLILMIFFFVAENPLVSLECSDVEEDLQ